MLRFSVDGAPFGWQRATPLSGRGVKPTGLRQYQQYVGTLAMLAMAKAGHREPLRGALSCRILARFPLPVSWPQRDRDLAEQGVIRPTITPDGDNIFKAIADACNRIVWLDDAQVVETAVSKYYSAAYGVDVLVEQIGSAEDQRGMARDGVKSAAKAKSLASARGGDHHVRR